MYLKFYVVKPYQTQIIIQSVYIFILSPQCLKEVFNIFATISEMHLKSCREESPRKYKQTGIDYSFPFKY